jgi:NitT/TauT family transport system permease protein
VTTTTVERPGGPRPRGFFRKVGAVLTSPRAARPTLYLSLLALWVVVAELRPRVPTPWKVTEFVYLELTGGSHGGVLKGIWIPHVTVTLQRFAIGLIISIVVGLAVGVLIGSWRYFHAFFNDTLLVFLALPAIIWAFITVIWFGLGNQAPVWTTVLTAFPFVAVNVAHGVQAVTKDLHLMSNAFGVSFYRRLRHLILPAITGYFFAGMRFAVIVGWNGILLAEWFGSADGVGWRIRYWYDANRYQGFIGWVLLVVVFIILVDQVILAPMERRAFRWRDIQSQQIKLTGQPDVAETV